MIKVAQFRLVGSCSCCYVTRDPKGWRPTGNVNDWKETMISLTKRRQRIVCLYYIL